MDHEARPRLRLITTADPPAAPPSRRRAHRILRTMIALIGVAQIVLGVAQAAGVSFVQAGDGGHLSNETAAWNAAIGTALLTVASSGRCSRAVFIMLTAFVATLVLVSPSDILDNGVNADRLATHLLAAAGYVVIVLLRRKSS